MKKILSITFLFLSLLSFGQNVKTELETFVPQKSHYSFVTLTFNVPAFDRKLKVDSVSFEGSLIVPKTGFDKIVIIKPGTGYNTRNTHSYLAEALLDNNIAVFRYDERNVGNSKGTGGGDMLYSATMMGAELASAFNHLKKQSLLKGKKFGIIGHSIGGVALTDALKYHIDPDFLVLLSAPVLSGKQIFLYQLQHNENGFCDYFIYDTLQEKEKVCNELIDFYIANHDTKNFWKLYKIKMKEIGYSKKRYTTKFPFLMGRVERDLAIKDNTYLLKNIKVPLFYMIGSKDVLVEPIVNVKLLKNFNNQYIDTIILEGENHFFADGESYEMHNEAKQKIVDWILKQ